MTEQTGPFRTDADREPQEDTGARTGRPPVGERVWPRSFADRLTAPCRASGP